VVATPIGNLRDMSLRALEILREADLLLCEDTRTARKLLSRYRIRGKKLLSLYRENERKRLREVLAALGRGRRVVLLSEAGTPGISDPGALVVAEVRKAGYSVVPVPGPSALTALLSVSGFDAGKGFVFLGFPPARRGERLKWLESVKGLPFLLVFFVPPHRLCTFLEDALAVLGNRRAVLGRELTKVFEEILALHLEELVRLFRKREARGEFVLVVEGALPGTGRGSVEEAVEEVRALRRKGRSLREAVKEVAFRRNLSAKELYRRVVDAEGRDAPSEGNSPEPGA